MLTNLAADLSSCLLNFRNITGEYILNVGDFVYLLDCIVYKQINSLTRALSRVTGVQNRSVEILLTSGNKVKRNCNDIVQMNDNDNEHIDILDFPLYERQSDLLNHQSQFQLKIPTFEANLPLADLPSLQTDPNDDEDRYNPDDDHNKNDDEDNVTDHFLPDEQEMTEDHQALSDYLGGTTIIL